MNIAITIFSLIGIYIAYRIAREKKQKLAGQKMVCFVGEDCDKVVFSEYSKFLGISLEKMGLAYYIVLTLVYLTAAIRPSLLNDFVMFIVLGMTFGGLLFSLYLTAIQIVKLKNYCSWCISSAITSIIIFVLVLTKNLMSGNKIFEYINSYSKIISLTKSVSEILVLGVTVFLITNKKNNANTLRIATQVNWFATFLFILSHINKTISLPFSSWLTIVLLLLNFINIKLARRLIILSTKADNK